MFGKLVAATIAAGMFLFAITPPANAAGGAIPDSSGTVYMYVNEGEILIDVLTTPEREAGVTVCRVAEPVAEAPGEAFTSRGELFVSMYSGGRLDVVYRLCDDSTVYPPVNIHIVGITVKTVKESKARKGTFKFTNRNKQIVNVDGKTVLNGKVQCLYGSFKNPEPDASVNIKAGATKTVKSSRARLDYMCFTEYGGVFAGSKGKFPEMASAATSSSGWMR